MDIKRKITKGHNHNLTVCIIAKNNQDIIADAIESVQWADEIIVVDTGSTDLTKEVAVRLGAKVVTYSKGSYNEWRNKGLEKTNTEWILYLDTDEQVTPELRKEIESVISNPKYNAYAIPRKNIVLGEELKHGGFGDDYVKRLFKTDKLKRWKGELHEEPEFYSGGRLTSGSRTDLGHLKSKMVHRKAKTISEMLTKTNWWSEKEAILMFNSHHPPMNIVRFSTAMWREFWYRFVKKRAYLDGPVGIIHGLYQVFSRFVSYAKLWELQEKSINKNE